jgi:phosphoserine aminotransferase
MTRVVNFNPGPSTLPLAALERARNELLDIQESGMAIHDQAIALVRELLQVPDTHHVLFMQGGARAQFALVPMNLRTDTHAGDYVVTGVWAKGAYDEAKLVGKPRLAADTGKDGKWTRIPRQNELQLTPDAPYLHFTSNNTVMGTQYFEFPTAAGTAPLVCDMSSDLMWRPIDVSKFGLIYAGAQKNLGPAGITLVIVRKDLVEKGRTDIPTIFRYSEIAKNNSLQNTIPTFAVYMVRNVLETFKARGGLGAIERDNREKGEMLYRAIDESEGFYTCPVEKSARSVMNAVFRLANEDAENKFVKAAEKEGLVGLKGHRSVGGIRVSMYNAMEVTGVEKLVDFMARFRRT